MQRVQFSAALTMLACVRARALRAMLLVGTRLPSQPCRTAVDE